MTTWTKGLKTAPKDKAIWIWSPSFAGGSIAAYWHSENKWWSRKGGAGSCLVWTYDNAEDHYHWMLRTEPPAGPTGDAE